MGGVKKNHIILNQNLTDPAKIISGDINSDAIQWIRANSHRYLGKYTGTGQMTICQLADVNPEGATGAYYHDGVTEVQAPLCGGVDSLCEWWMRLPSFYYSIQRIDIDTYDISFSDVDGYEKWDENQLIGCFKATNGDPGLTARGNLTPARSLSRESIIDSIAKRGDGYSSVTWRQHCIMALLFYAMYGTTDSQSVCGSGSPISGKSTGVTASLGMTDTVAGGNGDSNSINFWGLENWWGDLREIIVNAYYSHGFFVDDEVIGKRQIGSLASGNGFIKRMVLGSQFDLCPFELGGSESTGYCDYLFQNTDVDFDIKSVSRAFVDDRSNGGISFLGIDSSAEITYPDFGTRLSFFGDIIIESDISTFRSIPVTNIEVPPVCP